MQLCECESDVAETPGHTNGEPDDPANELPNERLEKTARLKRGPYQPHLARYPVKITGKGKNARSRSFLSKWYKDYNWLEYSRVKDAAYCFACRCFVLHGRAIRGVIDDAFIYSGFSSWNKAVERFNKHKDSNVHKSSVEGWEAFLKDEAVDVQLVEQKQAELTAREKQRLKNVEYMKRLVDVVRTLAKGGKPLRGHDEKQESNEKGLFLEIVNLLQKYDPVFKEYTESAPDNCTYLSNRIQNDILCALKNVILRQIQKEVEGVPISIIADETSDVSNHEQIAVFLRYIPKGKIYPVETFVALQRLQTTDAETIFNSIENTLTEMGILWKDVEGVCFDGASAMSGRFSGVQARCKEMKESILYVHCYGHCLNLSLVSACSNYKENPKIFDFFGVIQLVYNYIEGSPKRHAVFENIMKSSNLKLKYLKSLSETRWACRSEAVSVVQAQLNIIIKALEESVENSSDAKTKAKGKGILYQMKSFDFIICLEVVHPILQLVVQVSKTLQSPNIDLCQAVEEVSSLALALEEFRIEAAVFDGIFSRATDACHSLGVDIPEPKTRKISVKLDSNASNSFTVRDIKEEVRLFVFYPILDKMIESLSSRFSQETKEVICAVGKAMSLGVGSYKMEASDFEYLSKQFSVNPSELEAEIRILKTKKSEHFPPSNAPGWLKWLSEYNRETTFSNFKTVIEKFSTIPVTSCSCERSFSKLSIVKSKLRSTMLQDRLEHLLIPFVEQELTANTDLDDVIEQFKQMVPFNRRMNL